MYEWSRKFINGVSSVTGSPRPGQAHRVVTTEAIAYATETWTTTKNDERRPSVFEREILRRIYGLICEGGQRRKR